MRWSISSSVHTKNSKFLAGYSSYCVCWAQCVRYRGETLSARCQAIRIALTWRLHTKPYAQSEVVCALVPNSPVLNPSYDGSFDRSNVLSTDVDRLISRWRCQVSNRPLTSERIHLAESVRSTDSTDYYQKSICRRILKYEHHMMVLREEFRDIPPVKNPRGNQPTFSGNFTHLTTPLILRTINHVPPSCVLWPASPPLSSDFQKILEKNFEKSKKSQSCPQKKKVSLWKMESLSNSGLTKRSNHNF